MQKFHKTLKKYIKNSWKFVCNFCTKFWHIGGVITKQKCGNSKKVRKNAGNSGLKAQTQTQTGYGSSRRLLERWISPEGQTLDLMVHTRVQEWTRPVQMNQFGSLQYKTKNTGPQTHQTLTFSLFSSDSLIFSRPLSSSPHSIIVFTRSFMIFELSTMNQPTN
jgi:hypothetical protein